MFSTGSGVLRDLVWLSELQGRELSRASESSEQFVWLNRPYDETETQLSRSAVTPSIRANSSQDEVI